MNWIILYLISFFAIIIVLVVGYFLACQANSYFVYFRDKQCNKVSAKELTELLVKKNGLKNVAITTLNAKKTNYYSTNYNAIKLSPETITSNHLYDLAIGTKCVQRAIHHQRFYFTSTIQIILQTIAKIFLSLFVPILLISSILNISFGLEKFAYISILVGLICFVAGFLIIFIYNFINSSTSKNSEKLLKSLKIFDESELKDLQELILALNKQDFFKHTRFSLSFFSLMSPAMIFERNRK